MNLITVAEAAEKLGIHRSRVHVLIQENKLPAKLYGRTYLIDEKDLAKVKTYGKAGRPTNEQRGKPTKPTKKKSKKAVK